MRRHGKKKNFSKDQKQKLLEYARSIIEYFYKGLIITDAPDPDNWGEHWMITSDGYPVHFNEAYLKACREFTGLASRMLKAKNAHEKTIRTMCQKAGQKYVQQIAASEEMCLCTLENAAKGLVDEVLNEAGREYDPIEPNFLIKHVVPDVITIGRVRFMPTELASENTALLRNSKIQLKVGDDLKLRMGNSCNTLSMPPSLWMVNVAATKENVTEEAKWHIDIAVSLIKLSIKQWQDHLPIGEVEGHPTHPAMHVKPYMTKEGDIVSARNRKFHRWYEMNAEVVRELTSPEVQLKAEAIFNPTDRSLAQHVAHGLGWMTRGRQASDRAERLISFFTALEALLSSSDKSAPVVETISHRLSVIYTQDIKKRFEVYKQIKGLYDLRSKVVHTGQRQVLWQNVNNLQAYTETIYRIVLNRCDLKMTQKCFAESLTDASHEMRWKFVIPPD